MYLDSSYEDDELAYEVTERVAAPPSRERVAMNERLSISGAQKRANQARYSRQRSKSAQLFNGAHRRGSKKSA